MPPPYCYLTISGHTVTLTFNLLTSKSTQFMLVPDCSKSCKFDEICTKTLYLFIYYYARWQPDIQLYKQ